MKACCLRAFVSGKVQGVGYRYATQEQALQSKITGHAKNLADGRVEVLMCGDSEKVKALSEWLWKGPAQARVTHIECEAVDASSVPEHFSMH
ncbi:MAG: acylphosphatase [Halomonadaceae bacterium]|uniref:acylphosphatase n=1 Tax=Halomonas colorata TaxID=2742615 RepID=A0ABR9FZQ1_9GAMM|nr:acylphosphatase [Halomonas colorata]MBE0464134.1 acylphosphatase [Halomonas colorata]